MAQVKKLQGGGNPTTNKYLMFNGTKIVEGDDNFKQLEQQALNGNRAAQSMLNTLRSNSYDNSMVVNTTDNGVDFQNVNMNYYNDRTGKQFEKGDNWWRRNVSRTREGKDYIKDFTELRFTTPDEKKEETKSDLDKITKASRIFSYKNGEYDAYNLDNASHEKAVRDIARYFSYGNKDEAAKYFDVSDLGNVDALWTIFNNAKESGQNIDFEKFIRDVRSERRLNDWDDPTFRILQNFGFIGYDPNSLEEISVKNNIRLKELGFDPEKTKGVLTFDKDGNLVLDQNFSNSVGEELENKNGNYWFNDQFASMLVNGESNPYAWLNGWTAIGNKLYKSDEQKVKDFILDSGFVDKNKQSLYNDANDIMQSLWGNQIQFDKYYPDNFHSNWAKDKQGLRYRGISGYDIGKDELGRDNQLVEYYDNSDERDAYGYVYTPRYAILNGNGDFVKDVNINDLILSADAPSSTEVIMNKILDASQGKHFAGKYQELFQGNNGLSDLKVFTDPNTGGIIIQDSDLKGDQRGKAIILPAELAKTIKDSKWFEYINKNKDAKERFYESLQQLTSSAVGDFLSWGNISDWWFGRKDDLKTDFINAGYSPEEAEEFANMMEKWTRNTRSAFKSINGRPNQSTRESYVLREPFKSDKYKDGGKIEKHAIGDLIGESKGTKGSTKVNKVEGNTDTIKKSWGIGSKDSKEWSDVDTATAVALVSDLGSLGLSFAPGANIAATTAGAAGSLATFVADTKRDGLDWGDVGSLGLNLVMDAGTLIPFAGGAVKGAKVVKAIKKAAPTLIKMASIYGLGDAFINTVNKVSKGESFTLDDVRRIVNGVSGGITLSRTGLLPAIKKTTTKANVLKSNKSGEPELTVDLDKVKKSPKKDQLIELQSQITSEYRKLNKNTKLTDDEILKLYDIDTKNKLDLKWKFWNSTKESVPNLKSKSKWKELTNDEIIKKSRNRNSFQNWFFGTNRPQPKVFENTIRPTYKQFMYGPNGKITEKSIFTGDNFTSRHMIPGVYYYNLPNMTSPTQIPEEKYYPGTEPVYEFKQGGILKGKYGLSFNDAKKSAFDKWGITKDTFNPKPYTITAPVEQNTEETIPSVTKSTTQQTDTTNRTTSGNGSLGFEFDKNQFASAALEAGNFIRGWNETNKVKDIYNKKSQALLNTQASHLPEVGMRFQNPIYSQYDKNISDLYHRTGMNAGTTSDAKLQAAMFSDANNTAMNYRTQQNQAMSDAWTNYQNQNLQNRQKYAQANWEIDQQNAQKRYAASDLKLTGEADTLSQRSQMQDKLFNKIQGMLYRHGMVDSNIEGQKYQINLAKANALATNKDANVSGYDSMLKTLNSKDYKKYMSDKAYYGTLSAAKGGKLRPTSEQMLLDNQKLVAKAIEKMNDNTMKLILKALS